MTPEQIAADRIARAVEKETGLPMEPAARIGKAAVEYIAAAGLVVLTAERAARMVDALREVVRAHDSFMDTIQDQLAAGNMRRDPLGEAVEQARAALKGGA